MTPIAPISPPNAPFHVAFVSKASFVPGTGVSGADAICEAEALAAGLEGDFLALLPTKGASAMSRLVSDGRPIVRPDGVVVADSEAAFGAGGWLAPISLVATADAQEGYLHVWAAAETPADLSNGSCFGFSQVASDTSALAQLAGVPWNSGTSYMLCDETIGRVFCVSR